MFRARPSAHQPCVRACVCTVAADARAPHSGIRAFPMSELVKQRLHVPQAKTLLHRSVTGAGGGPASSAASLSTSVSYAPPPAFVGAATLGLSGFHHRREIPTCLFPVYSFGPACSGRPVDGPVKEVKLGSGARKAGFTFGREGDEEHELWIPVRLLAAPSVLTPKLIHWGARCAHPWRVFLLPRLCLRSLKVGSAHMANPWSYIIRSACAHACVATVSRHRAHAAAVVCPRRTVLLSLAANSWWGRTRWFKKRKPHPSAHRGKATQLLEYRRTRGAFVTRRARTKPLLLPRCAPPR